MLSAMGSVRSSGALVAMVQRGAPLAEVAAYLTDLAPALRVEEVGSVRGNLVGRLFDLAGDGDALTPDQLVAADLPAGAAISLQGRNSLPAFSGFRKRFTRSAQGMVFGYNDQAWGWLVGPGYFVVTASERDSKELLFDYTRPPPFEPAGWPPYAPNERGLSRPVFGGLHDYVRRVADGVFVGAAFRNGAPDNAFFTLTRR